MTDIQLIDALRAYDDGATDSGIKDDVAKKDLFARFHDEVNRTGKDPVAITDYAANLLSPEGLESGYTLEDVASFITWLGDHGCDV